MAQLPDSNNCNEGKKIEELIEKDEYLKKQLAEIEKLDDEGKLFEAYEAILALKKYLASSGKNNKNNNNVTVDMLKQHKLIQFVEKKHTETQNMLKFMTDETTNWTLIKQDSNWKSEFIENKNTSTHSFRITGVATNCPLFNIIAVVYEMDLIKAWMPLCKESTQLGHPSLYCKCGLIRIGVVWPLQDRETILFGYGIDDLKNGKSLIYFDSNPNYKNKLDFEIPKCPNNRVRVDVHLGGFYFEKITSSTTKITAVWNTDPKMNVPYAVLNWFTGQFVSVLLQRIVDASKFDSKSIYAQRIQQKTEFYEPIKQKILESKSTSNNQNGGENGKAI